MSKERRHEDARRCPGGDHLGALMLGYCRGEREAFEALYPRVAPVVFAELLAWTGDRRRAEELLDRAFRTLHENRSAYVEGADPRPWISQIARHEFLAERRHRSGAGPRALWSRLRTAVTRGGTLELGAP